MNLPTVHKKKALLVTLMALALVLMYLHSVSTAFRQSTVWNGPYLSAAANLSWPLAFNIDNGEIQIFNALDDTWDEDRYRFGKSATLTHYQYNDLGYVYLIWVAKKSFPFAGDQQAIILLQALVHLLLCGLLLYDAHFSKSWRVLFFVLYAINPLILKYVVFNHYYFWQSVPSLLLLVVAHRRVQPALLWTGLVLWPWALLARTTGLLAAPLIVYFLYRHYGYRLTLLAVVYCLVVGVVFFKPSEKNIWHTAYIGTGAYQNPYGIKLSDEEGFALYQKAYGQPLSGATGGNVYQPEVYQQYKALSKSTFLSQLGESPWLYLKNAIANTLGAFSLGYLTGRPDWMNYVLALTGLGIVVFFVKLGLWVPLIGVALLSLSYTLYYPPIPAYTFGSYALLAGGLATGIGKLRNRARGRILYLSFNDGSDMRINKEIRTLSRLAPVDMVALGTDATQCYAAAASNRLHYIHGSRKTPGTLLRYILKSASLLTTGNFQSVHIINEPQLLLLWPFLWFQKQVVLDIFDSLFLRKNRPGNQWAWIKRIVYAPVDRVLVTDENRLGLLPDFLKARAFIVPNYPYRLAALPARQRAPHLTLMYFGWLGELRGTETVRELLDADPTLRVIMAGWLADEPSRLLTQHPRVEWLGVLPQAEATHLAAQRADYILCVYAPINDNNINASPNKIYDAIQTGTPVIINAEVKVSGFVDQHGIGYVLPQYRPAHYKAMARELFQKRTSYTYDKALQEEYTWERVEDILLSAH
jgi:hypothetical protein